MVYGSIWGGDNWRTVNASANPHISDQLGTEYPCWTLLCWSIVMIWVVVCNNIYRNFGFSGRYQPIWRRFQLRVNGSTVSTRTSQRIFFYWNATIGTHYTTNVCLSQKNVKIKWKEYLSYRFLLECSHATWIVLICTITLDPSTKIEIPRSGPSSRYFKQQLIHFVIIMALEMSFGNRCFITVLFCVVALANFWWAESS